jgi:hypothetical protein
MSVENYKDRALHVITTPRDDFLEDILRIKEHTDNIYDMYISYVCMLLGKERTLQIINSLPDERVHIPNSFTPIRDVHSDGARNLQDIDNAIQMITLFLHMYSYVINNTNDEDRASTTPGYPNRATELIERLILIGREVRQLHQNTPRRRNSGGAKRRRTNRKRKN